MVKIESVGGWHLFFLIYFWILLSVASIYIAMVLFILFKMSIKYTDVDYARYFIHLIYAAINLWVTQKIISIYKKRDPLVPKKIITLWTNLTIIGVGLFLIELFIFYELHLTKGKPSGGIIGIVIWYFLITQYFKRSKRIEAYYSEMHTNEISGEQG